jgi:cytochrome c553
MKKHVLVFVSALFATTFATIGLAQGDAAAGQAKSALCATCHGADGNSALAVNPKLAGQNASYLMKQLTDYKSGARVNPTMAAMAAGLSDESLYRGGNSELSVAACSACHSPSGSGNGPAGFPALGGQHPEYTLIQLKAFRAGERANDDNAMMRSIVERLTDKELEALASYVSGLH